MKIRPRFYRTASALLMVTLASGYIAPLHARRSPEPVYDLVIVNGRVVDGTGNPWFRADVALKNGRIARIGHVAPSEAKQLIDARGQIVAPGFIDVHTHVESIYKQP